jgi:hypothetical protein
MFVLRAQYSNSYIICDVNQMCEIRDGTVSTTDLRSLKRHQ